MNDESTNQTPNLDAYIDDDERSLFDDEFDTDELIALENAFDILEQTFITLYNISEGHPQILLNALGSIHDNARDLAYDPD